MKKFFVLLIALALAMSLIACVETEAVESSPSLQANGPAVKEIFYGGMEFVGGYVDNDNGGREFYYYRDIVTDVMYVCFNGYRKGGLTEMSGPETGLPLTYARYLELAPYR